MNYILLLLSFEGGGFGSHYVEESFWKRLWTCRQTDSILNNNNNNLLVDILIIWYGVSTCLCLSATGTTSFCSKEPSHYAISSVHSRIHCCRLIPSIPIRIPEPIFIPFVILKLFRF
jgi:hypothetical protein